MSRWAGRLSGSSHCPGFDTRRPRRTQSHGHGVGRRARRDHVVDDRDALTLKVAADAKNAGSETPSRVPVEIRLRWRIDEAIDAPRQSRQPKLPREHDRQLVGLVEPSRSETARVKRNDGQRVDRCASANELGRQELAQGSPQQSLAAEFERAQVLRQRQRINERGANGVDVPCGCRTSARTAGRRHAATPARRIDTQEVAATVGAEAGAGFAAAARTRRRT